MSKFEILADELRRQIQSGQLRPDERLVAISELRAKYGIRQGTMRSVMLVLKAEGLVTGRPEEGVFITSREGRAA